MTKSGRFSGRRVFGLLALTLACAAATLILAQTKSEAAHRARVGVVTPQEERLDIRLRSFAPGASGRVTVEPSTGGGRVRLTALSLPAPQNFAPAARTYVIWASSGGRIQNLGELRLDERGNGGFAFDHPSGFDSYSVIVTAEASGAPARPGAPVLTSRAGEAHALYPPANATTTTTTASTPPSTSTTPAPPRPGVVRTRPRYTGRDFYTEVDDALTSSGSRRIELEGERIAPRARGTARTAVQTGRAYVRANFTGVPLPSTIGASVYAMWAIVPDGRMIYMGSLPVTEKLSDAEIYVRVGNFDADTFDLFVTAERQRPVAAPSDTRILTPKNAKVIK
jgi:hypothetical protein